MPDTVIVCMRTTPRISSDDKTTAYMQRFRTALRSMGDSEEDKYIRHYAGLMTVSQKRGTGISQVLLSGQKISSTEPKSETWEPVARLNLSDRNLLCMSVKGDEVVVGGTDHSLRVVSTANQVLRLKRELHSKQCGHADWVTTVDHLSDGRIVSGGMDSKLCLWTGVRCRDLLGHAGSISRVKVASSPHIISSSYDRSIKVWDIASGQAILTLQGHTGAILDFVFCNLAQVVTASRDSTVRLWDIHVGKPFATFSGHKGHVSAITKIEGSLVATGGQDATVILWDLRQQDPGVKRKLFAPGAAVSNLVATPSELVAAGADGTTAVLSVAKSFSTVSSWGGDHDKFIYTLGTFGKDTVVTGGDDGTIAVRTTSGILRKKVKLDDNAVRAIDMTPDGHLVTISDDGNLVLI